MHLYLSTLIQMSKESLLHNMENEKTTVENNDCVFVDIDCVEQSLSKGISLRNFRISVSSLSAEVVSFTKVCFIFCFFFIFFKINFFTTIVTRLPFGF